MTTEDGKIGMCKTPQGSTEGAWLMDTTEHVTSVVAKTQHARKELAAYRYVDFASAQEDT